MYLKKTDIKLLAVLLLAILVSYVYFHLASLRYQLVTSFDECVTAGFPVLTKYPEECKMPGKIFINQRQEKMKDVTAFSGKENALKDFQNISYIYDGQTIVLVKGLGVASSSENESNIKHFQAVASSSLIMDITDDLEKDTIFLLTSVEGKNSNTVYHLAAAIRLYEGYTGSNIVALGISSSTPVLTYKNGEIIVIGFSIERKFIFDKNLLTEKK